jgi:hypothetical protein
MTNLFLQIYYTSLAHWWTERASNCLILGAVVSRNVVILAGGARAKYACLQMLELT